MKPHLNTDKKNLIRLEVKIDIPENTTVNDIYGIAEKLVDAAIIYRDNIMAFTAVYILLLLIIFVFIFYSAGYIPKHDEPVARGLHAIPFDITAFAFLILVLFELFLFFSKEAWYMFISIFLAVITLISFLYSFVVRYRAKKLKANTIVFKTYNALKNASEALEDSKSAKLKIAVTAIIFLTVSAFELLCFLVLGFSSEMMSLVIFFLRILEIPILIFFLVSLAALHNGAKNISKGNIQYRIKNPLLTGALKKHAEYLNNINDAVNTAVEERMRSESLKTELITNVSHDLKTPLTSIVNYVDLLKKENISSEKAMEYIEVIDRQSQRLKKLTFDIVEASKAATGNIKAESEELNLNVIMLQTKGEYLERLEEKNLKLIEEIPENDILITADGRLLWRIIDNLMNNICKYSLPGTRVYLTLHKDSGNACISFRNISREAPNTDAENLTERFVRGDTSRNTEGSGLGLSIANSLTELMNGCLNVTTDGDLFKVTLTFPAIN